jgi:hypothetical protein
VAADVSGAARSTVSGDRGGGVGVVDDMGVPPSRAGPPAPR